MIAKIVTGDKTHIDAAPFSPSRLSPAMADFAILDVRTGLGLGVVSGGRVITGHKGLAGQEMHRAIRVCEKSRRVLDWGFETTMMMGEGNGR